jgi:uncharacterized protein YyaL (SSP411 family)
VLGWSLTVFLTPTLKPFYGGTYFPLKIGSVYQSFKRLLITIAEFWNKDRARIKEASLNTIKIRRGG